MSFQFQCPQGHLLEGDPSHAGQQCVCPTCGMLFIIPAPLQAPVAEANPWSPGGAQPSPWAAMAATQETAQPTYAPEQAAQTASPQQAPVEQAPQEPELLHIPCPNGHELETPLDMLDQDVLCPQCQAQFTLRRRDSIEYKKKKEQEDLIREAKANKMALNAAIIAAVLVGLLLVGLVVAAIMR